MIWRFCSQLSTKIRHFYMIEVIFFHDLGHHINRPTLIILAREVSWKNQTTAILRHLMVLKYVDNYSSTAVSSSVFN